MSKKMEDYRINKIYASPEDMYSWQDRIKGYIAGTENCDGITILAPEGYGKTYFCRDVVNEGLEMLSPGANVLYYSPDNKTCDRVAVTSAFIQKGHMTKDYTVTNEEQQTIVVPASMAQLKKILSSAMKFDLIVIDDADMISNPVLHSVVLKNMIDDGKLIIVGTSYERQEVQLTKSIWKWLLNHPCYTAFEVIRPSSIADSEEYDSGNLALSHLISILHPQNYRYTA